MQEPVSDLDNGTHKILWDFEIQTDDLIPARISDIKIITKRKKTYISSRWFCGYTDHGVEMKESKKINIYFIFTNPST